MAKASEKKREHKQSTSADRLEARRLFVNEWMTCEQIAVKLGFSRGTVHSWKQKAKKSGEDWEAAQKAAVLAGEGSSAAIASMVYIFTLKMDELAKKTDQESEKMSAKELAAIMASAGDSMGKITAVARHLAPNLSEYAVAADTIKELLQFVTEHHPEHGPAVAEILEPFGAHIARIYK